MKKKDFKSKELSPIHLDEIAAEKVLLDPLLAADEGTLDLSEDFFDQMHDKIMAKIEDVEIRPAPKPWQRIRWQVYAKFAVAMMTTMVCVVSIAMAYNSSSSAKGKVAQNRNAKYERLLHAALQSPDQFSTMVTASLGQDDFFVDVASRNSDHLSLGDLNGIMGFAHNRN